MAQQADPRAQLSRLLEDLRAAPSAEVRTLVAEHVGHTFANHPLSNYERSLAYTICEACAADLEVRVREALARQLCASPLLPRELALRLAEDVQAVASPVLLYSLVLTDDDLLAIIATASQDKLLAISRRKSVSAKVGSQLIERGDVRVVRSVLANPNAQLKETSLHRAMARYPGDEGVHEALVERPHLPPSVATKLVAKISDELVQRLVARRDFPPQMILDIARRSEETVMISLQDQKIAGLVEALQAQGKLTPLVVLRAIALRERTFFTAAMALLTRRPASHIEAILFRGEAHERSELYRLAGLPAPLFSAFNAVLSTLRDADEAGTDLKRDVFEKEVVFRFAQTYPTVSPTNIDQAIAQIERSVFH